MAHSDGSDLLQGQRATRLATGRVMRTLLGDNGVLARRLTAEE